MTQRSFSAAIRVAVVLEVAQPQRRAALEDHPMTRGLMGDRGEHVREHVVALDGLGVYALRVGDSREVAAPDHAETSSIA